MALAKASACFFLFVALIGATLVSLPSINNHAVARHGDDALKSYTALSNYSPDPDRDEDEAYFQGTGTDGKTYHILRLPKLPGRGTMWAIVITCGTVGGHCLVTAFLCGSKKYVKRIKDDCR
jgi:hypothetical protein